MKYTVSFARVVPLWYAVCDGWELLGRHCLIPQRLHRAGWVWHLQTRFQKLRYLLVPFGARLDSPRWLCLQFGDKAWCRYLMGDDLGFLSPGFSPACLEL